MQQQYLPGRLGDPSSTLLKDRRTDPRIVAAQEAAGDLAADLDPIAAGSSYSECLKYCADFETVAAAAHPLMEAAMPAFDGVVTTTKSDSRC